MLQYHVDKTDSYFAQNSKFARRREDAKFQQIVYRNIQLQEIINIHDVRKFVYAEKIFIKPICNVL